jgi:diguanylate cyclase (GGDEF)-like protein/PAS domain S-box-containing protein
MRNFILHHRYWALSPLIWGLLVLASLLWNQAEMERKSINLAYDRAQFIFKMMESTRLWSARHGGVYAPITDESQPNPYLKVPEREITTPSGIHLTLINPAYMTRQIGDVVVELSQLYMHLTSLKPINPTNEADAWEELQLKKFERPGVKLQGFGELIGKGKEASYRFLAPLRVEKPCLKCHEHQGYKLGDIRGGLSISFAAEPFLAPERQQFYKIALTHLGVWLLLSLLSLVALSRLRTEMLALEAAKARTEDEVLQRTTELRTEIIERQQAEAKLRLLIESSGEGIIGMNAQGFCTLVNSVALRLLGLESAKELLGQSVHEHIHHSHANGLAHSSNVCALYDSLRTGCTIHDENDVFWRADGSHFPVEYRCHPLYSDSGLQGAVITFNDISARKATEIKLRTLSSAVEHSPAAVVITDSTGMIQYVNPHYVAMTGYQPEEVIGKNPRVWQSGLTPLATYQEMWKTITAGNVWHHELRNKTKDGRLFWEAMRIAPIKDGEGNITHFVAIKEDISQRKAKEENIWRQANFDSLTGLPNRKLLANRMEQSLALTNRNSGQLAMLYIDLDGFKQVNDTLGHAMGDLLLKEAAQRMQSCLRESDTLARLGGDEFVILLPLIESRQSCEVVAGKLLKTLEQPFDLNGNEGLISASIGIAFYPDDAQDAKTLLLQADDAMYQAKAAGRATWHFYQT